MNLIKSLGLKLCRPTFRLSRVEVGISQGNTEEKYEILILTGFGNRRACIRGNRVSASQSKVQLVAIGLKLADHHTRSAHGSCHKIYVPHWGEKDSTGLQKFFGKVLGY